MLRFSKCKCTLLVALIALLLMTTVCICSAASIPKPSVPVFTVQFVNHSSDTPTTYSINPYTGANEIHPSSHSELQTLEVLIKNQPFTPYTTQGTPNWTVGLFYNIRVKGAFSQDWIELYRPSDGYPVQDLSAEYTVISLGNLGGNGITLTTNAKMVEVPAGGLVDFQVEAMTGYVHRGYNPNTTDQLRMWPWIFTGETSGWSDTQTITIDWNAVTTVTMTTPPPASTQTPTATAVPTQNLPDQPVTQTNILPAIEWKDIVIATSGIVIAVLVLALVLSRKRSVRAALG